MVVEGGAVIGFWCGGDMVLVAIVTGLWFGGFEGRVYIYFVGWVWVLDFGL
jgi:hypothetical protein